LVPVLTHLHHHTETWVELRWGPEGADEVKMVRGGGV
jgi:hypothetical protein